MSLPSIVVDHLAAHHAVASRTELTVGLGFPRGEVHGWLVRRFLKAVLLGTYVDPCAPWAPWSDMRSAVLRGGRGALLVGGASLYAHGLLGAPSGRLDIATPSDRRPVQGTDLARRRFDETGRLSSLQYRQVDIPEVDRAEVNGVPTLTLVRAVLEEVAVRPRDRARRLVDAARHGGMPLRQLLLRAEALTDHEGAALVRDLHAAGAFAQESDEERRFQAAVLVMVTPKPQWQVWLLPDARPDMVWSDAWLTGEWDSVAFHSSAVEVEADRRRDDRIRATGHEVARFRDVHLLDPVRTAAALQELIDVRTAHFATPEGRAIAGTAAGGRLPRTMYSTAARALLAP